MELESLGLFPLHAVLVPGAALGLRVFEPRYLDLVRDCGRNGGGFGICLIMDGEEAGAAAKPAAFGTEAVIEDFDTDDMRSEEHTSELQSLMRISYAVFCLK